jgi:transposase-like protein
VGQPDQQQQDEWHRGEQRVEGQGAGQERDVVFVSRLKSAGEEAGG